MKKWYKFPNNTILDVNLFNSFWHELRPDKKTILFGKDSNYTYELGEFEGKDECIKFMDALFAHMKSED